MFKMLSVLLTLVGLGMEFWKIGASTFAAGEGIYLAGEECLWDLGQSDRVSSLHSPALPWTGTLEIERTLENLSFFRKDQQSTQLTLEDSIFVNIKDSEIP